MLSDLERRRWAAYYGTIALGYAMEYDLKLDRAEVEKLVRNASSKAVERLKQIAEDAIRRAPIKDFDIERKAARQLSRAGRETLAQTNRERAREAVARLHVDRSGYLSGPGAGATPLRVWRAMRRRVLPLCRAQRRESRGSRRRSRACSARSSRGSPRRRRQGDDHEHDVGLPHLPQAAV